MNPVYEPLVKFLHRNELDVRSSLFGCEVFIQRAPGKILYGAVPQEDSWFNGQQGNACELSAKSKDGSAIKTFFVALHPSPWPSLRCSTPPRDHWPRACKREAYPATAQGEQGSMAAPRHLRHEVRHAGGPNRFLSKAPVCVLFPRAHPVVVRVSGASKLEVSQSSRT